MPERAHVTSLEALEFFRSNLLVYISKARPTLDEVSAEVVRMRSWLEDEQRLHWENERQRRRRDFDEAQQALFSAKLSSLREASSAEQMAVHRTRRALEAAEAKLKVAKQWDRVYDNRVGPLVKQMEKLHTVLAHDMVQAVGHLTQAIQTLEAYKRMVPPATTEATRGNHGTTPPEGEP